MVPGNELSPAGTAKVLIVEDNSTTREILRAILRSDDRVTVIGTAMTGEKALEFVEAHDTDLVCLDIGLPGLDGFVVLKELRAKHPNIRVLMISGEATSQAVKDSLKAGASGFVVKPFNAEKVLRSVHAALAAPVPAPKAS